MNTTHNGIDFVRAAILEHRAAQAAAAAQVTCTGCKIPRYPRRFVLSPGERFCIAHSAYKRKGEKKASASKQKIMSIKSLNREKKVH